MAKKDVNTQKENEKVKSQPKKVKSEKTVKADAKETVKKVKKVEVVEERKEKTSLKDSKIVVAAKKVDEYRMPIIVGVVCFLLATLLFRCILWPDRIATLKDGTQPIVTIGEDVVTADNLYVSLKENYTNSLNVLLTSVDTKILNELYPDTDESKAEISANAEYYYSVYQSYYGYTKEEFLKAYNFASEEQFLLDLTLDYKRQKFYDEYAKSLVSDKEIEKYYTSDVFGDVDSKHILVEIDEEKGLKDSEAKALAQEIIGKLNKGTSWEDVIKEYGDKIISEELGYNAFNASLEASYLAECKNLKVGTYSKTPVKTSYGYHIVYKIDQKDKPGLEDVKESVLTILANQKKSDDTNLYYKALDKMRKDANMDFADTVFADKYKEYMENYK